MKTQIDYRSEDLFTALYKTSNSILCTHLNAMSITVQRCVILYSIKVNCEISKHKHHTRTHMNEHTQIDETKWNMLIVYFYSFTLHLTSLQINASKMEMNVKRQIENKVTTAQMTERNKSYENQRHQREYVWICSNSNTIRKLPANFFSAFNSSTKYTLYLKWNWIESKYEWEKQCLWSLLCVNIFSSILTNARSTHWLQQINTYTHNHALKHTNEHKNLSSVK